MWTVPFGLLQHWRVSNMLHVCKDLTNYSFLLCQWLLYEFRIKYRYFDILAIDHNGRNLTSSKVAFCPPHKISVIDARWRAPTAQEEALWRRRTGGISFEKSLAYRGVPYQNPAKWLYPGSISVLLRLATRIIHARSSRFDIRARTHR